MSMSHTDIAKPKESGMPAVEQSQWGQGFLAREPVTHAFWVLLCQCVWAVADSIAELLYYALCGGKLKSCKSGYKESKVKWCVR